MTVAEQIIDLSNYRDRFGSRVPEGDYLVAIEDIEVTESRAGNPMWVNYYRIIGGEHDGSNLVDRVTISERTMFRVVSFLNALGVRTPRKRIKVDTSRLVGKRMVVQVGDGEPYNGKVRSEVREYMKPTGAAEEQVDLDDLANLEESTVGGSESVGAAANVLAAGARVNEAVAQVDASVSSNVDAELDDLDIL